MQLRSTALPSSEPDTLLGSGADCWDVTARATGVQMAIPGSVGSLGVNFVPAKGCAMDYVWNKVLAFLDVVQTQQRRAEHRSKLGVVNHVHHGAPTAGKERDYENTGCVTAQVCIA